MAIMIGTYIGRKSNKSSWTPQRDSIFWASERSGDTIPEVNGNDVKVLPAVYKGNSSGYYPYYTSAFFSSDDWVLYLDVEITGTPTNTPFIGQGANMLFRYANGWLFTMSDGTNNRNITISVATLPLQSRKYTFKIVHDKDGSTTIFEGGNQVGTASGTFGNLDAVGSARYNYFGYNAGAGGALQATSSLITGRVYSDIAETTLVASYIFTGDTRCLDISGNNRNITGEGIVATNKAYSINGSRYLLDSGWTLWQHTTTADINVPYGNTSNPIASGYSTTKVYGGDTDGLNMADCFVGFNETGSAADALKIFDRSNTDIFEDAARTGYYSSTSLATKSRFHISELYPYEKFRAMFKIAYKDIAFVKIEKDLAKFNLIEFIVNNKQATGRTLTQIKEYCNHDSIFTVGADLNFKSLHRAYNYAYDDYALNIEDGTYSALGGVPVVWGTLSKRMNYIGTGVNGPLIWFSNTLGAASADIMILTANSSFTKCTFDNRQFAASGRKYNIYVNGCTVNFTNCQLGRFYVTDSYQASRMLKIANAGIVNYTGGVIESANPTGIECDIQIQDSSQFNFDGISLQASLVASGTSSSIIKTDYHYFSSNESYDVALSGTATMSFTIDIAQKYLVRATNIEDITNTFPLVSGKVDGAGDLTLSGNGWVSGMGILGTADGASVLLKDFNYPKGQGCTGIGLGAVNCSVTFDNADVFLDCDNDGTGLHIIEEVSQDQATNVINIINGSRLEFSGHQGLWFTMGQPVSVTCRLVIRNSTIIDNGDDNIPFGENYPGAVLCWAKLDIEDSVITVQNQDGVGTNKCINFQKQPAGANLNIRLKNVVLNSDSERPSDAVIRYQSASDVIEANDWMYLENVTNNSSQALFISDHGVSADILAALQANYPGE